MPRSRSRSRSMPRSRSRSHSVTMFLTRSRGRGKITVEFFSALMLFKVCVKSMVRIMMIVMRNMTEAFPRIMAMVI